MSQEIEIENQEYHFVINLFDFSTTFLIVPNYDDYLFTLDKLKSREDVSSFFVIKGENVFTYHSC